MAPTLDAPSFPGSIRIRDWLDPDQRRHSLGTRIAAIGEKTPFVADCAEIAAADRFDAEPLQSHSRQRVQVREPFAFSSRKGDECRARGRIARDECIADIVERNFDTTKDSRARRGPRQTTDFYSWYYAMLAFYDLDGPSGASWRKLNTLVTGSLMKKQELHGCREGSWDAAKDVWCCRAGRACATAMNVLSLEVYYRYAPTPPAPAKAR